jgi:acyl-coenzyme A synthetase/AMP-(fatty) acid ligase
MQFGLSESVEHWGRYRPDAPAVYSNGNCLSYRELNARVNALCSRLASDGFLGPRIAVAAKSKLDTLIAYLSVLRLGKSVVVLNSALKAEAIRTNLDDTQATEFIHDVSFSDWRGLFPSAPRAVSLADVNWSSELQTPEKPEARPCDEWGVLFSSGTTGTPKAIERDHYSMVTELIGWCLELPLSRHTTFYIGRPIFYTGGLVLTASTLLVGGTVVLNDYADDNNPRLVWTDYQAFGTKHEMQWAFFIPDQLRAFIGLAAAGLASSAKNVVTMGAPITASEKLEARARLGSAMVESWGNSESLGTITDPEDLDTRPNSVGRPFLTDELIVVDESGKEIQARAEGRIAGAEEAGFARYSGRPEATERVKQRNLIISDDIGYLDEQGYLYVRGREQDSFIVGGRNYFVRDLEESLRVLPGIVELVVVSLPSETGDATLCALVVQDAQRTFSEAELLRGLNGLLSAPLKLERAALVDAIPRVPSGKVDKSACKVLVTAPR